MSSVSDFAIDAKVRGQATKTRTSSSKNEMGYKTCFNSERFLSYDKFGQPLSFNFHRGSATYRSNAGSCVSLLIGAITLIFTVQ